MIRQGFDTLVEAGYAPELAYFECLHELKFIVDLIHEQGLSGMRSRISETARWGELTIGPQIIDGRVHARMKEALRNIRTGKFAKEFMREMGSGRKRYTKLIQAQEKHPIEVTGKRLRGLMRWKKKK